MVLQGISPIYPYCFLIVISLVLIGLTRNRIIIIIKPLRAAVSVRRKAMKSRAHGALFDSSYNSVSAPSCRHHNSCFASSAGNTELQADSQWHHFRAQYACLSSLVWAEGSLNTTGSQYHTVPSRPDFSMAYGGWNIRTRIRKGKANLNFTIQDNFDGKFLLRYQGIGQRNLDLDSKY